MSQDICENIDILIVLLHGFNNNKIRIQKKTLIKIAWIRNWADAWCRSEGFGDFDD